MIRFIFTLFFLLSSASSALAGAPAQERMITISKQLRCVVCENESIYESRAEMAATIREVIYDQIQAGKSDQEIFDYLQRRYSDRIFLRPPFAARTFMLWFAPVVLLIIGLGFLWPIFKRKRR